MEENSEDYVTNLWELHLPKHIVELLQSGNRVLIRGYENQLMGAIVPIGDFEILEEFDEAEEQMESEALAEASKDTSEDWDTVKDKV